MSKNKKSNETKKSSAIKEKMNLYVVDTIVTFRHRYVIEAKSIEHAYDEITMKDSGNDDDYFEEMSQKFLGEAIIDGRQITKRDFSDMLEDAQHNDSEHASYWLGEQLIRKINYKK